MKTRRQRRATSLVEVMSVMTVISLVITGLSVCIARIGKLDREIVVERPEEREIIAMQRPERDAWTDQHESSRSLMSGRFRRGGQDSIRRADIPYMNKWQLPGAGEAAPGSCHEPCWWWLRGAVAARELRCSVRALIIEFALSGWPREPTLCDSCERSTSLSSRPADSSSACIDNGPKVTHCTSVKLPIRYGDGDG